MGKRIIMKQNIKNNGFVIVEAAIVMPIFIIGIITIAYLMKYIIIQENILYNICEESQKIARNAYYLKSNPFYPKKMEELLVLENPKVEYFNTDKYSYLYSNNNIEGLIKYEVSYWINIKAPIQLYKGLPGKETVLFRGLVGRKYNVKKTTFEEMEKEIISEIVYIFPDSGEKYHKFSCPYISVFPTQSILTEAIKRSYRPCNLCKSAKVENGKLIYYFPKTGEAFHKGQCSSVEKYTVKIEKELAIKKGYTSCKTCGG